MTTTISTICGTTAKVDATWLDRLRHCCPHVLPDEFHAFELDGDDAYTVGETMAAHPDGDPAQAELIRDSGGFIIATEN